MPSPVESGLSSPKIFKFNVCANATLGIVLSLCERLKFEVCNTINDEI